MADNFKQDCGSFTVTGNYGGHPHWHDIESKGLTYGEFRTLTIKDIHDLRYALDRAIAFHDAHVRRAER